jgi:hypothetical protein
MNLMTIETSAFGQRDVYKFIFGICTVFFGMTGIAQIGAFLSNGKTFHFWFWMLFAIRFMTKHAIRINRPVYKTFPHYAFVAISARLFLPQSSSIEKNKGKYGHQYSKNNPPRTKLLRL